MYSVSIFNFGTELGRPSICLMFNSSHNVTRRFPSRCFVIKTAGLTEPRIFSILSSWFFSFCCSHKYFVSMCLIVPLPLRRANPRAAAASVQTVLCVQVLVPYWPIQWLHWHSVPCCSILTLHCSVTPLSPKYVVQHTNIVQMSKVSSSGNQQHQHQRVHRSPRCSLRVATGIPTRHVEYGEDIVRYVSDA